MAFITAKSNIRTSILNFIKHLVSKTVLRAIDIILSPCCNNTITSVDITCGDSGYDVTITFTGTTHLFGNGFGILYIDGVPTAVQGVYNDNGTITFTNVSLSEGTYSVNLLMLMATSNGENTQGVYITSTGGVDADAPACVS